MLIVFLCDVGICDRFSFVNSHDSEIRGVFDQIEAMQQMDVINHDMANVANVEIKSEDEYVGTGTDGSPFGIVNNMDADRCDTDTSQHRGTVSLMNTVRKQFKGLTPGK